MKSSPNLLLALCLVSPLVSADIFKCVDAKGNDKYQNFPCQIDSIGSKATAAPPREEPLRPTMQAGMAPPPSMWNLKQPEPGMKMNDVRVAWGAPKSTKVIKGVEVWYYDGPSGTTHGVRFDRSGTVVAVAEAAESKESGGSGNDE